LERRHGRYDDSSLEEGIIDSHEEDWDFSYTPPTSIVRNRSSLEPPLDNDSIMFSVQDMSTSSSPARTIARKTTRPLSHLGILCASPNCAVKPEPESLYYQTIDIDRPRRRPEPPRHRGATKVKSGTEVTRSERKARDTNHTRRPLEQDLIESTIKPKQQEEKVKPLENHNSNGDIPISAISFQRQVEERVPASCAGLPSFVATKPREYETKKRKPPSKHAATNQEEKVDEINTDVSTAPIPVNACRREDERVPTLTRKAVPSSIGTYFSSDKVASVVKAIQRDNEQSPSTSVDDVLDELSELQVQLDSLRLTQSVTRDVLLDATKLADTASELLEFPPEENEQMMDGLPFQAFESKRDAPDEAKATAFSKLVDVLAQHEDRALEEAFVDKGVRIRQFGCEGDGPGTLDSSFSIVIHDDDEEEDDDSSPTPLKPQTKGFCRKPGMKMSKSDSTETSSLQKQKSKSSKLSSTRDVAADATSEPAVVDKFQPLTSPREGPEPPPPLLKSESWSPAPLYPKSRRETRSSFATIQNSDPPRKYFSIRGALDSFVRRSKATSSSSSTQVSSSTKSVRFAKKLVTSVHYRPMTLPEDIDLLYFSTEELEELERDRDERIYEEQFEIVTGRDYKDVAVTYPVRRIELPTRRNPPAVEEPTISPPGLLDISDSWSSNSEKEQPEGYEV